MGTLLYTAILSLYSASPTKTYKMPKGSGLTKPLALSAELADLVGAKKGEQLSRPEVVKRIWAYLKANKLQDPENKQYFKPDAKMKPIFGEDKVRAFGMAKFLKSHLTNPVLFQVKSIFSHPEWVLHITLHPFQSLDTLLTSITSWLLSDKLSSIFRHTNLPSHTNVDCTINEIMIDDHFQHVYILTSKVFFTFCHINTIH